VGFWGLWVDCVVGAAAAELPGVPGVLPAAFGRPGEGLERPGRAVVSDFLNKVLKLAALRITDICDRLDFEPLDRNQIVSQVLPSFLHLPMRRHPSRVNVLVCKASGKNSFM
jgi:hypothetical protein